MPLSQINPNRYQQQLDEKLDRISQQFRAFYKPPIDVFASAPLHYRMRAEFKLWHQDDDSYFVMFRPDQPKLPQRINDFPIASKRINSLMKTVLGAIRTDSVLRRKLFQVEFLTTTSDEALITLIYHRKLDEAWEEQARQFSVDSGARIIGRSKKQKLVLDKDYVTEHLQVDKRSYYYQQLEGSFTQPNAGINQQMLEWALRYSRDNGGDLLELYCGNANFTAVLAQNFQQVLATEISKASVKSAQHNLALNGIDNVSIARMSSEEISRALAGAREFRRLREINLGSYRFSTVLVDPPRAGLDELTEQLVSRFDNIIYVSCNPDTLHRNLQGICQTHRVKRFAVFDQFPYTHHIECGVMLERNEGEHHE